jgi:alkylglycerol monooxygenase
MHELIILMAVPLFFTLIACEAMLATRRRVGARVRANDAMTSVGLGAMSQVTGVFWRLAMVWTYVVTYEHLRLFELPKRWWIWPLALGLYDLCYYWHHRLMHEVAVFWAAHSVHHSSEAFNLTTALRKPSTGFLVAWVFYLPLALIGITPAVFVVVGLINLLYQYWIHTEQIGSLGWLDRVLCTPSNHRVHHATNERYLDKNYGGILILWDRLFGSFVEESRDDPCVYGVKTPVRTFDPVRVNLWPYAEVWQRLRLVRALRSCTTRSSRAVSLRMLASSSSLACCWRRTFSGWGQGCR